MRTTARLGLLELGQGDADGLAVFKAQRDGLGGQGDVGHLGHPAGNVDLGAQFGGAGVELLVGFELVAQAAHEPAAAARDFLRVEREALLLGHANGNGVEITAHPAAAQLLAAVAQATDHARSIAHANLAHVHAHMELACQAAHKLAEVDTFLSLEEEDGLLAVEQKLHLYRMHVGVGFLHQVPKRDERLGGARVELFLLLLVGRGGDAQHGLQGRVKAGDKIVGNVHDARGELAELVTALGAHDHVVVRVQIKPGRVEPKDLGANIQFNGSNLNHRLPFLS